MACCFTVTQVLEQQRHKVSTETEISSCPRHRFPHILWWFRFHPSGSYVLVQLFVAYFFLTNVYLQSRLYIYEIKSVILPYVKYKWPTLCPHFSSHCKFPYICPLVTANRQTGLTQQVKNKYFCTNISMRGLIHTYCESSVLSKYPEVKRLSNKPHLCIIPWWEAGA